MEVPEDIVSLHFIFGEFGWFRVDAGHLSGLLCYSAASLISALGSSVWIMSSHISDCRQSLQLTPRS